MSVILPLMTERIDKKIKKHLKGMRESKNIICEIFQRERIFAELIVDCQIELNKDVYGLISGTDEFYSFVIGRKEGRPWRIVAWARLTVCGKPHEITEMRWL